MAGNRVPAQAAIPVLQHVEDREAGAQVLLHHVGAVDLMRTAFTQEQEARGVVDLTVHQHDRGDAGIPFALFGLQRLKAFQLSANVG